MDPDDAGDAFFRKMGRVAYPTPQEEQEWERIHGKRYYNNDPILTFEEKMEAKIAPSVQIVASQINGLNRNEQERLALFEWVNVTLQSLIRI
jgi:hypothetical protein